jgi:hypothetical protein
MGKMTPSRAKNSIRRALFGIVDPHPNASQIDQIWSFFDSSCAYCGRRLVRGNRDAHIDHLVSTVSGGTNALANFVLACGICNGDEKREKDWQSFLGKKAADEGVYKLRSERIEKWIASCSSTNVWDPSVLTVLNQEVDHTIAAFDVALKRIRELKNRGA